MSFLYLFIPTPKRLYRRLLPQLLFCTARHRCLHILQDQIRAVPHIQLQMRKIKEDGKVDNQDLIEKVMTVYGMCATREEEENYE